LTFKRVLAIVLVLALTAGIMMFTLPQNVADAADEGTLPSADIEEIPAGQEIVAYMYGGDERDLETYELITGRIFTLNKSVDFDDQFNDWNTDFVFKVESGAVDKSKLYVAGQYDYNNENWVVIPCSEIMGDGILMAGAEIRVLDLIDEVMPISKMAQFVDKFQCGLIDISEDKSAFAPGTSVGAEVNLYETEDGGDETGSVIVAEIVDPVEVEESYDVNELPEKPAMTALTGDELKVTMIDNVTYTLKKGYKFEIAEENVDEKIYKDWIVDFVLTINSGSIDFSKVVLCGQYDAYGEKWAPCEISGTMTEGDSLRLLRLAGMDDVTYAEAVDTVKKFQCGFIDLDGTGCEPGTEISVEFVVFPIFNGVEIETDPIVISDPIEFEPNAVKSISSVNVDSDGNLIITYSDGTTQNLGKIKGEDGKDACVDNANANGLAIASTVLSAIAVLMMFGVAVYVIKAKKN
ncbi:MAG: hypothetical protein MJ068_03605, partial [Clostridia bacterium]|nr:hypothetical protein [Clostridia bacterium]